MAQVGPTNGLVGSDNLLIMYISDIGNIRHFLQFTNINCMKLKI